MPSCASAGSATTPTPLAPRSAITLGLWMSGPSVLMGFCASSTASRVSCRALSTPGQKPALSDTRTVSLLITSPPGWPAASRGPRALARVTTRPLSVRGTSGPGISMGAPMMMSILGKRGMPCLKARLVPRMTAGTVTTPSPKREETDARVQRRQALSLVAMALRKQPQHLVLLQDLEARA